MAYTQSDLDNLDKAIATGAKSVRFGTGENAHETVFRSLAEMEAIRATIAAALVPSTGSKRVTYAEFSRD